MRFAGLDFDCPGDWLDVTDDLPPETPPTMARADGVGVIQFSVARYKAGVLPNISADDLRDMAQEFCASNGFAAIRVAAVEPSRSLVAGGSSSTADDAIGIWYLSDGTNVALVTYFATSPPLPAARDEMRVAADLVRTVTFAAID